MIMAIIMIFRIIIMITIKHEGCNVQVDYVEGNEIIILPASLGVLPHIAAQDSFLFPQSLLTAIT